MWAERAAGTYRYTVDAVTPRCSATPLTVSIPSLSNALATSSSTAVRTRGLPSSCGTSHHWARDFTALSHEVQLLPPAYVKSCVKRGKSDANDAAAICEAVTRARMAFTPVNSTEQQAALALHRTRDLMVMQGTQPVNMIPACSPSRKSRRRSVWGMPSN